MTGHLLGYFILFPSLSPTLFSCCPLLHHVSWSMPPGLGNTIFTSIDSLSSSIFLVTMFFFMYHVYFWLPLYLGSLVPSSTVCWLSPLYCILLLCLFLFCYLSFLSPLPWTALPGAVTQHIFHMCSTGFSHGHFLLFYSFSRAWVFPTNMNVLPLFFSLIKNHFSTIHQFVTITLGTNFSIHYYTLLLLLHRQLIQSPQTTFCTSNHQSLYYSLC